VDWFQTPRGQLLVSGNIFEVVRLHISCGHLPACLLKHT
jgi:hypothetical protein